MILPIFKTHGSFGHSILIVKDEGKKTSNQEEEKISIEGPVSILSIVQKYKIKFPIIIDDNFLSFPDIYKHLNSFCHIIFGVNFTCCNDIKDKSSESMRTESKVSILMKNSHGYKDLLKIYNLVNTNKDYFYYHPRIDWKTLNDLWTENLFLMLPPYDNFIHNNYLKDGACIPFFGKINPLFTFAKMELPFDALLFDAIIEYTTNNKFELQEVHPIYYMNDYDMKPYMVHRCVDNRTCMSNPDLDYMTSNRFSFESYLRKIETHV